VRDDQRVDAADASAGKIRQDDRLGHATAASIRGSRIVKQRLVGRAEHDRRSLPHIEHVNLERRELRVMQALHDIKGQGPTLGPPKTESAVRTVPVAESIAVRLAAHIEECVEDAEPDALVFTSLRSGPLLNTQQFIFVQ